MNLLEAGLDTFMPAAQGDDAKRLLEPVAGGADGASAKGPASEAATGMEPQTQGSAPSPLKGDSCRSSKKRGVLRSVDGKGTRDWAHIGKEKRRRFDAVARTCHCHAAGRN